MCSKCLVATLGAETWNLPAAGGAALGSVTHGDGDGMHSWAAFIGNQWLSRLQVPRT